MSEWRLRRYGAEPNAPEVWLIMDESEGAALAERLGDLGWTLVVVSGVDWNRDLSPWPAKAVFRGQLDFGDGAEETLRRIEEWIRSAEGMKPAKRYIVGYSLAGLFAVWAGLRSEYFDGVVSVSGSMWFPGFAEYVEHKERSLKAAYFSVGEREKLSRNPAFRTIDECTERVAASLRNRGARTVFEKNPGGHFDDPIGRLERAIRWLRETEEQ